MGHGLVDQLLEKAKSGELRWPVSSTFGMDLVAFGLGEAAYGMPARAEFGNPRGLIQGGVVTALADAAIAAATAPVLEDEEITHSAITTVDIFARVICLSPAPGCRLRRLPDRLERASHDDSRARRCLGAGRRRGA